MDPLDRAKEVFVSLAMDKTEKEKCRYYLHGFGRTTSLPCLVMLLFMNWLVAHYFWESAAEHLVTTSEAKAR